MKPFLINVIRKLAGESPRKIYSLFQKDPTEEQIRQMKYRKLLNNHDQMKSAIIKAFEEYDKNKNGLLSCAELLSYLNYIDKLLTLPDSTPE